MRAGYCAVALSAREFVGRNAATVTSARNLLRNLLAVARQRERERKLRPCLQLHASNSASRDRSDERAAAAATAQTLDACTPEGARAEVEASPQIPPVAPAQTKGDPRGSHPRQPKPQSGALPTELWSPEDAKNNARARFGQSRASEVSDLKPPLSSPSLC